MTALLRIEDLIVEGRPPSGIWIETVHQCSVDVNAGEVVALIGESGAGKTTVALASLGYTRPGTRFKQGRVFLEDRNVLQMSAKDKRDLRGKEVAYVAQSAQAALNPAIPIGDQIVESLVLHGFAEGAAAQKRAVELLDLLDLPHPEVIAHRYPHQTSGGQQQRIMMAMAMACRPKLLVLDEPTTALDVTTQIEVLKAIKDVIREHNTAAIYVSHDLSVVAQVSDRILVMNQGYVVEENDTGNILNNAKEEYTRTLLGAVKPKPTRETAVSDWDPAVDEMPIMTVKQVDATYERPKMFQTIEREQYVLHDIDIGVYPREVLAVVGESGSGKSTLARVMAGLHPSLAGEVTLSGETLPTHARTRTKEQLRRIQIIFQSPDQSINPEKRIDDAIGRPLELYFGMRGSEKHDRVAELLEMVGLDPDYAGRFPSELSGGQRQRVSIARAFAARPDVILCDEVLSALDTVVAARVLDLMKQLREEHKVAYVFISHDLSTVASLADRVAVMYAGRIIDAGLTKEVFAPPHHPYTQLLINSVPALRQGWLEEIIGTQEAEAGMRSNVMLHDEPCPFRMRCPMMIPGTCDTQPAPRQQMGSGHVIYCQHNDRELLKAQSTPDC
ncbi:MAG: ABC transporter ATP-binding protein [Rhodospirillales bacterium]|nr:ABC transporter ATP-binding protein [Rhodospirillales bacterium]